MWLDQDDQALEPVRACAENSSYSRGRCGSAVAVEQVIAWSLSTSTQSSRPRCRRHERRGSVVNCDEWQAVLVLQPHALDEGGIGEALLDSWMAALMVSQPVSPSCNTCPGGLVDVVVDHARARRIEDGRNAGMGGGDGGGGGPGGDGGGEAGEEGGAVAAAMAAEAGMEEGGRGDIGGCRGGRCTAARQGLGGGDGERWRGRTDAQPGRWIGGASEGAQAAENRVWRQPATAVLRLRRQRRARAEPGSCAVRKHTPRWGCRCHRRGRGRSPSKLVAVGTRPRSRRCDER